MQKLKKLFGEYDMSWPRVIVFAFITAVYTALINQVPFLKDTSFQDIAVNLDCWFVFAIFIVVNCKKWWEASLKCFVFFLISQPLIYLIEVPFIGWSVFGFYKYWAVITVLTLPGAAVAFLVKKKNLLSVAVLSVATGYLSYITVKYFYRTTTNFPHHILSALFCLAAAVLLVFILFDEKKLRIISVAVIALVFAATAIIAKPNSKKIVILDEGTWTYTIENEDIAKVKISDEGVAELSAKHNGNTVITFENSDGEKREYVITVSGGDILVNSIE